jgi:6-phosphogluconolactonase
MNRINKIFVILAIVASACFLSSNVAVAQNYLVFFGTHSVGPGKGFSVAHFNSETGELTKPQLVEEAPAPAYFIIHPNGKFLYTCNSNDFAKGYTGQTITAYKIDSESGRLQLINQQSSGGADPSFISMDSSGKYLFVANYKGGSIAVIEINPDCSLGKITSNIFHSGRSVDSLRQTQPYAHSVRPDPSNRFTLAADLRVDKLFVYRFDALTGSLAPGDPPFVSVTPGSGPRHTAFHPDGKFLYLVNEMASNVITYRWDPSSGRLTELQTSSTLPADYKGKNACAEIEVSHDGKFLYASNRGYESIAVFSVNRRTGKISLVENVPTLGHSPRNFTFDPTGKWLIVTNHLSNNAVVFKVDKRNGHLTPVGEPVTVESPFCVRFLLVSK